MSSDRVTLTVPAKGEYAKTVRMTAAALSSRMGMTYDEVDDVRMASEEAFVYACDTVTPGGEVELQFDVDDDEISITVALGSEETLSDEDAERRASYATFILQSVCDRFELSSDENGPRLQVVKCKGPETGDAE